MSTFCRAALRASNLIETYFCSGEIEAVWGTGTVSGDIGSGVDGSDPVEVQLAENQAIDADKHSLGEGGCNTLPVEAFTDDGVH